MFGKIHMSSSFRFLKWGLFELSETSTVLDVDQLADIWTAQYGSISELILDIDTDIVSVDFYK